MSLTVDIRKKMGDFLLDVSFTSSGGSLGILGASGTGKSVMLQCIAGILRPDEGRIVLNGRILFDSTDRVCIPPQKRRIGYLFQNYALFPNMTVRQNIFAGIRKGTRREKQNRTEQALRVFRLEDAADQYPSALSGGQQQRTALARILVGKPEAILLDEPFSAMDRHLREQLMWELARTLGSFPGDVLMVSHEREEITRFCDTAVVMDRGSSEPVQRIESILREPKTVADAKLAGYFNIADAVRNGNGEVVVPAWGIRWKDCRIDRSFEAVCVPDDAVILSKTESEGSIPCTICGVTKGTDRMKALVRPLSDSDVAYLQGDVSFDTEVGSDVWGSIRMDRVMFLKHN